jgi:hypothetical protein
MTYNDRSSALRQHIRGDRQVDLDWLQTDDKVEPCRFSMGRSVGKNTEVPSGRYLGVHGTFFMRLARKRKNQKIDYSAVLGFSRGADP